MSFILVFFLDNQVVSLSHHHSCARDCTLLLQRSRGVLLGNDIVKQFLKQVFITLIRNKRRSFSLAGHLGEIFKIFGHLLLNVHILCCYRFLSLTQRRCFWLDHILSCRFFIMQFQLEVWSDSQRVFTLTYEP